MKKEFTPEEVAEAQELLRQAAKDKRWDCRVNPVKVSDELLKNIKAKQDPNYVPLESGRGRVGNGHE